MSDDAEIMLEVHEIAACYPQMPEAAFRDFKGDIAAHGLLVPILTFQGKIIDGRHRYRACRELGVRPRFQEWAGEVPLQGLVVSLNGHRRHATKSQLAVAAAKIANLGVGRPQEKAQICAITQRKAAEGMGISRRQVQKAAELIRKGEPCLSDAVARGEVDLDPAWEVAGLDAREQTDLVSSGAKAITRKAAEIRRKQEAQKLDDQCGKVGDAKATSVAPVADSSSAGVRPKDYPVRAMLADPARFDSGVRLWQVLYEWSVRDGVAPFAADDPLFMFARYSSLFDPIDEVRMMAPPGDWPLCWVCKGSGKRADRMEGCEHCQGGGFLFKRTTLACDQPAKPNRDDAGSGDPEIGVETHHSGRRPRRSGRHRLRSVTADGEGST